MANKVLVVLQDIDVENISTIFPFLLQKNLKKISPNDGVTPMVSIFDYLMTTKYYEAQLQFVFIRLIDSNSTTFIPQLSRYDIDLLEQQAIILAYKKDFDIITQFAEYATHLGASFETCLCVSIEENNNSERIKNWCIDFGYEWIGNGHQELEEEEDDGLFLSKNITGVKRVEEALQCTMWTNMKKLSLAPQEKPKVETLLEEDPSIEHFDQLLEAMIKLRTEGDKMDHEKRKREAANLATKLFNMLVEEEDEQEDDDDSEANI